jgi:DHA2 family multidrug resistance protein
VRVFTVAVACFGLCSALCGLAPSLGLLVACRILQGLSGGPMMPLSQTLMMRIFPPHQRAQAMGLWAMTAVVGPVAGPLLGGAILDHLSWPWIFYINVPVAIGIVVGLGPLVSRYETPTLRRPVDYVGLGLLVVWVSALQIMLDKGEEADWFNSPLIVLLGLTAIIGFFAFVFWEITQKDPIVNLKLFRARAFATACAAMSVTYGAFFGSVVLIPLWLQTVMGYTAAWAGRIMALQGVLAIILSPVVAQVARRIDPRAIAFFGVSVIGVVMALRSGLTTQATFWDVASTQILLGLGMSCFFIPLNVLGIGALKPEEVAAGSGLMNFLRTSSGAVAVSIVTTSWNNGAEKARTTLVSNLHADQTVSAMQASGFSHNQALGVIEQLTQQQSVMLSTQNLFLALACCAAASALTVWVAPRPPPQVEFGGGGH